jgi:hypothetical protein
MLPRHFYKTAAKSVGQDTSIQFKSLAKPAWPGVKVIILKLFSPKKLQFWRSLQLIRQKVVKILVFNKNANFFAENWQKSPKTDNTTLTPD